MKLGIVADDLTGAADSSVQFFRQGVRSIVLLGASHPPANVAGHDVVAIDTNSRSVSPCHAYDRVKDAALWLQNAGCKRVYKKLDSTLRGNPGSEIDAVMDVFGFDRAYVVPALPKAGRTTVGGRHYLNGIPVHLTEIARDPKAPVIDSDIMALLSSQTKRKIGLVTKGAIRIGGDAIVEAAVSLAGTGVQLFVFDAETQEDLQRIVAALGNCQCAALWAGSAGIAEYLPRTFGIHAGPCELVSIPRSTKPVLLVSGSASKVAEEQLSLLKLGLNIAWVRLDPRMLFAGEDVLLEEIHRSTEEIAGALAHGLDAALCAEFSFASTFEKSELRSSSMESAASSDRLIDAVAQIAAHVIDSHDLAGIILTGGDTARAVCERLRATALELIGELESGVPISRLIGCKELFTITKAGALGSKEVFVRALNILKGERYPCPDL